MPKIHEIVTIINNTLKADKFKSKRFQKGNFFGVAELMPNEQGETKPCSIDNGGDATFLSIDDSYPFIVYHRVLNIEPNRTMDDNFGNGIRREETANMKMVCYADRSKIKLTKEDLIGGFSAGWLYQILPTDITALGINDCDINMGSFETDSTTVYNSEFNLKENLLKPQTILFSLDYQIVTNYNVSCLTLCE